MIVFEDIKARKFSSFLTFFAISLGILSIFVIILVSQGFEQSIQKQFEQLGSNRLIITYSGSSSAALNFKDGLTDTEVKLVENRPYIKQVAPHIIKNVQIEYSNEFKQRSVMGANLDEAYFNDFNFKLDKGRFPKANERYSIVIGPAAATDIFKKDIQVGSNVYIKGVKFKVVGILESVGNPEDDKSFFVNIDTIRDIYEDGKNVNLMYATVEDNYDVNLAAENVKILLENKLGKDNINVQTLAQILEQITSILGIVQMTLGGIAAVSLIVGAFGIINTMYVIITEKTKDIGIMKAIGARNSDIFTIYIFQSGLFGFLGGALGVFFGSLGALAFGAWANANGFTFLEITITYTGVLGLLLFSFTIGAFAGFMPAYRASKLKIVDTFRK